MVIEELRKYLADYYYDSAILDRPAYDNSIVGVSTDGALVYDFDRMIAELMEDDGITEEDAVDFIEYHTFRAIGYFDGERKPVIIGERLGVR